VSEDGETGLEIAVIGMACRAPGATSKEALWRDLCAGRERIRRFTEEELLLAGRQVEDVLRDDYVAARGVLSDACAFDAAFFGVNEREARVMDPQHRVFVETVWHAFEDAGRTPGDGEDVVGVFAGAMENTYLQHHVAPHRAALADVSDPEIAVGNQGSYLPSRVSYLLDLHGPSVSISTACSTSLVAVHMACKALLSGDCDMAVAGGVAINFPEVAGYRCYDKDAGALSADGHCRPFSADANGTVLGGGSGAVLLKRLDDARRDGDRIQAIIRGTGVSNDGRRKIGFFAPSIEGQTAAIATALHVADVDPAGLAFVEAHGTGTLLGDQIEIRALSDAYGPSPDGRGRLLGSVKANIGHAGEAAGVISLVKSVMALGARHLPASLHAERPHPDLGSTRPAFRLATGPEDLAPTGPLLAGVSSFGLGGTNAHAILQSGEDARVRSEPEGEHLILVSARTTDQLGELAERYAKALEAASPAAFADMAYTSQVGRKALGRRLAVVARSPSEAAARLRAATIPVDGPLLGGGVEVLVADEPGGHLRADYRLEPAFHRALAQVRGGAADGDLDADARAAALSAVAKVFRDLVTGTAAGGEATHVVVVGSGGVQVRRRAAPAAAAIPGLSLLEALGVLWTQGVAIDWRRLHHGASRLRAKLPDYPFERRVLRVEGRAPTVPRAAPSAPPSPRPSPVEAVGGDFEAELRGTLEQTIAGVWAELLDRDQVAKDADFLSAGGDSLMMQRLAVRLREMFALDFPLRQLFQHPTVAAQAALVETLLLAKIEEVPARDCLVES
jgi:acyl transferase domain-containing protein